jgi:hypothetical protein
MIEVRGDDRRNRKQLGIGDILDDMRKRGLNLSDLYEIGGQDIRSEVIAEKARHVAHAWESMAAAGLRYSDLDAFLAVPANAETYAKQISPKFALQSAKSDPTKNISKISGLGRSKNGRLRP